MRSTRYHSPLASSLSPARAGARRMKAVATRLNMIHGAIPSWIGAEKAALRPFLRQTFQCHRKATAFLEPIRRAEILDTLDKRLLRCIVLLDACVKPYRTPFEGWWRSGTVARAGTMTAYIREKDLLSGEEIDRTDRSRSTSSRPAHETLKAVTSVDRLRVPASGHSVSELDS